MAAIGGETGRERAEAGGLSRRLVGVAGIRAFAFAGGAAVEPKVDSSR